MIRLPFRLPEFTRLAWVSPRAEAVWQPRIDRCASATVEVEWRSVASGLRACAVQVIDPESVDVLDEALGAEGLVAVEIDRIAARSGYSSAQQRPEPGAPFRSVVAIGHGSDPSDLVDAWRDGRQDVVGGLLGYPECCIEFFRTAWVEQQHIDTTWPMVAGAVSPAVTTVDVEGPAAANILLRWLGVRAVPHLPCRFDCAATVEFADRLGALAKELGLVDEMQWTSEMLSWPVEWSALHGIAEIRTPVVKITTATDATAEKLTVRRAGSRYPDEGGQGIAFPYRPPAAVPVALTTRFAAGLRNPIERVDVESRPAASSRAAAWRDNGFGSERTMVTAHAPIIEFVAGVHPVGHGRILDLGCGNGRLLEAVCGARPGLVPFGVDMSDSKIASARDRLGDDHDRFVAGDLFDAPGFWPDDFDVILLMPGRLLEVDESRAASLRSWLAAAAQVLVVYTYEGAAGPPLVELCRRAGLTLTDRHVTGTVGAAVPGSRPRPE